MKKLSIAAALLAAAAATPAMAQDVQLYAGPIVGYDSVKVSDGDQSESEDDVFYGVVAGADYQIGSAFIGAEVEYSDSSVGVGVNDVLNTGDTVSLVADRNLYAGLRVGSNLGATKIYAKGGYSNFRVSGLYNDGAVRVKASDELEGFVVGAGLEQALTQNFSLRAEYRYADYGSVNLLDEPTGADASRHQVTAGVLFNF